MPTLAKAGIGTTFSVGDAASPEVFTAIGEITSITGPARTGETIEVTALDSTGGYKQTITGLKDGGTVTLELNYINVADQNQMSADLDSGLEKNYQIVWPTSPTRSATFGCVVSGWDQSATPNEALTATVTLTISGQVTYA